MSDYEYNPDLQEDEIVEPTEIIEEPTAESESTETDDSQEGSDEVKEEPEFKPWKDKKLPESVPYDRFAEVNRERRELERRLSELESQRKEFDDLQKRAKEINTEADLNAKMSEMTIEEYNAHMLRLAEKRVEERFEARDRERIAREANEKLVRTYSDNVREYAVHQPEVVDAVNYLVELNLHPMVQNQIMKDPNAGELIYKLATSQSDLTAITGDPIDAVRHLGVVSSRLGVNAGSKSVLSTAVPKPVQPMKPVGSPKPIGTPQSARRTYSDAEIAQMSSSEYAKYRKKM